MPDRTITPRTGPSAGAPRSAQSPSTIDTIHDLAHRAVDLASGAMSAASAPDKPAYSAEDASQHLGGMVGKGAALVSGRQKQIDDAVRDAGG